MKESVRKEYKQKRAQLSIDDKKSKSKSARNMFLQSEFYKNSRCLMVYMSFGKETETDEIIKQALLDKKILSVPVTNAQTGEMRAVIIDENTQYTVGAFGIREPVSENICPIKDIDTVLIPGIAFDKKGNRMGFGKGCYDKFLEGFEGVKIGFCYDFQIAPDVPVEEYDIPMDYIICDKMIINCQY